MKLLVTAAFLFVAVSAIDVSVPLDAIAVRSWDRWVWMGGQQELPFSACFDTEDKFNWTAIEPLVVELSMPCNSSLTDVYITTFAYVYSYFRSSDRIYPTIRVLEPGVFNHTFDVMIPRTSLRSRDTMCMELDGPNSVQCDLSRLVLRVQ